MSQRLRNILSSKPLTARFVISVSKTKKLSKSITRLKNTKRPSFFQRQMLRQKKKGNLLSKHQWIRLVLVIKLHKGKTLQIFLTWIKSQTLSMKKLNYFIQVIIKDRFQENVSNVPLHLNPQRNKQSMKEKYMDSTKKILLCKMKYTIA